jgi:acetylornithine deacetylase/succinyl-diaminopimelate desuccinylase-like protein
MRKLVYVLWMAGASFALLPAQQGSDIGARLMQDAMVASALVAAKAGEPQVIRDQVRLSEIPAPPFKEEKRAAALRQIFDELGLSDVHIDKAGNVLGERPGLAPRPHLIFSAHLDTVFPEGTAVKTSASGTVIRGPGIGDDARGLAVMIGVIRALNQAKLQTPGSITFVGTVGEEGLGDLRGVKYLFQESLKDRIDFFVSVDGSGLGITTVGVGSYRYRITYRGPGGHSYGAFGLANPIHALGRAVARIAAFQVPQTPKTTFNVGRIGGGTSINSIAFEAWMEMDMRSVDPEALAALDRSFLEAIDQSLKEENERWQDRGKLSVEKRKVGVRPAGKTPENSPIVQIALSVTKALGQTASLGDGSTDSNIAMSLGIPAVTIGGGGKGSGGHSLNESFDSTLSWLGTQRATLLAIALAR